jgi:hypothetical protein
VLFDHHILQQLVRNGTLNLDMQLDVYIQHKCKQPVSLQPSLDVKRMPWIGLQWIFARKGLIVRSNKSTTFKVV